MKDEMLVRTIGALRQDTLCAGVILLKSRDEFGNDGVQLTAWHRHEGENLIQTDFVVLEERFVEGYMQDMSIDSAQDYIDSFQP